MLKKLYLLPVVFYLGCATTNNPNPSHIEKISRPTGRADIKSKDQEKLYSQLESNFTGNYTKTENDIQTNYNTKIDFLKKYSNNKEVGIIKLGNEELDISKIEKITVAERSNDKRIIFAYTTEHKKNYLSYINVRYYDFEIKKDDEMTGEYLETLRQYYNKINIGMIVDEDESDYKFSKLSPENIEKLCENGNLSDKNVELTGKILFDDCETNYENEISNLKSKITSSSGKNSNKNAYLVYCGNADVRSPKKCKDKSNMKLSYNRGFNLADKLYENLGNSLDNLVWMVHPNDNIKNERSAYVYFVTEKDQIVKK